MKTTIDIALECLFYLCGLGTKCKDAYTYCDMKSCQRVKIAQMSVDMVLKGEY